MKKLSKEIKGLLQIAILVLVIRFFIFEPFYIPSASMESTLQEGDFVIVWKGSYGYSKFSFSIPFVRGTVANFSGRLISDNRPERGDIAVFRYPKDTRVNYIKRIIGIPDDELQMKAGRLHINGTSTNRSELPDYTPFNSYVSYPHYFETLPSGYSYPIVERLGDTGGADNTQAFKVPSKHYFALGDNRDASQDSRFLQAVGYVPEENLIGRAAFIFFSLDRSVPWWHFWRSIRFDRIGKAL